MITERMKTHVLYVIDGMDFGGGERVFLQLAIGLKNHYHISTATTGGMIFERHLHSSGIQSYPVPMASQFFFKPVCRLVHIIKKNKIDFIHSQGSRADFFARIAGSIAGVPYNVCTIAAPIEKFDIGIIHKGIYRFLDRLTENCVDRFIVVSDALEKLLTVKRKIFGKRVVKIYNGIELQKYHSSGTFDNLRIELGIPGNAFLIGAIGRIIPSKGLEYLIEAMKVILVTHPEARLIIVGEGPVKDDLITKCKIMGIKDQVIFSGFIDDIRKVLVSIDLLAFPSLSEGFPMTILEAMAMEKPIIATCIDGVMEQISDAVEGLLVPPGNSEALMQAMKKVMEDRALACTLGSAARRKVENEFTVEKMIDATRHVYQSLCPN